MRLHSPILKFYSKLSIAALTLTVACATARSIPEPPPTPGSTTVYLVRHAEKVIANPNDPDPHISSSGRARAEALATRLGASGVNAIITTQFKRTQETAQPLASAIGVAPEVIPAGHVGDTDSVVAAVMRHRGGKVLIVGHSNTLAPIIAALGGPHLPNLCDSEYSNLFVLYIPATGTPELIRQRYGAGDLAGNVQACAAMQSQ